MWFSVVHRPTSLHYSVKDKGFDSCLVLPTLISPFALRHAATKGILVAMICTFFEAFNVPVFWPILVMYFIMLFCITMKRQIKVKIAALLCKAAVTILRLQYPWKSMLAFSAGIIFCVG